MNVLITGACGGLGRVMAAECAKRGYTLHLTDINESGLHLLKNGLIRQYGANISLYCCDLTSERLFEGFLSQLDEKGVEFDMLLNIAGVDHEGGFMKREREALVQIIELNNAATIRITHAILQRRRQNAPFTILFVSSLASMFPMPLKATYAASKRFILDFSLALRQELSSEGVRVSALCPGGLATTEESIKAIAAQGFFGTATANKLERVAKRAIDKALGGKARYIPGGLNRLLFVFGTVLPRPLIAWIVYKRFGAAQKKWLEIA